MTAPKLKPTIWLISTLALLSACAEKPRLLETWLEGPHDRSGGCGSAGQQSR